MENEQKEEINLIDAMNQLFDEDEHKNKKKTKKLAIILIIFFFAIGITIGILEYLKEEADIKIGDLGINKTHIAANENYNDFLSLNIKTDGKLTAKNERNGKALIVNGINEKVIRIVKTYNTTNQKESKIVALSESGNIYGYYNEKFSNDISSITFTKIDTKIKIYGIDINSKKSYIIGLDKDGINYKIDYVKDKWEVK